MSLGPKKRKLKQLFRRKSAAWAQQNLLFICFPGLRAKYCWLWTQPLEWASHTETFSWMSDHVPSCRKNKHSKLKVHERCWLLCCQTWEIWPMQTNSQRSEANHYLLDRNKLDPMLFSHQCHSKKNLHVLLFPKQSSQKPFLENQEWKKAVGICIMKGILLESWLCFLTTHLTA